MSDPVNHPSHYTQGGLEVIDILRAKLSPEEFQGFLRGNVLKYVLRSSHKGREQEDLNKADWYLRELRKPGVMRELLAATGDQVTGVSHKGVTMKKKK